MHFIYFVGLVPLQIPQSEDMSASRSEHGDLDDDTTEDISRSEAIPLLTPEHLAKLYVFSIIWGMGAFLETGDRLKYDVFMKEHLSNLDLPVNNNKNPDVSNKLLIKIIMFELLILQPLILDITLQCILNPLQ